MSKTKWICAMTLCGAVAVLLSNVIFQLTSFDAAAAAAATKETEQVVYVLELPDGTTQLACGARYSLLQGSTRTFEFDPCVTVFRDGFEAR